MNRGPGSTSRSSGEQTRHAVLSLWKQGLRRKQIAHEANRSIYTVRRILADAGQRFAHSAAKMREDQDQ